MHQRIGSGRDAVARVLQGVQVLGGHVLVVEGEHRGAVGHAAEGVGVAVVPEDDVGGDERGRVGRVRREDAERLPERHGRLVRHPGELPATDHRHDGQAGTGIDG